MADFRERLECSISSILNNQASWCWHKWDLVELDEDELAPPPTEFEFEDKCTIGELVDKIIDFAASENEAYIAIVNVLGNKYYKLEAEY